MRTIHLLPTFHHDVAYLRRCDEYLVDCEKILDEALRLLSSSQAYTFMVEQVLLLDWYWKKRPEQRESLKTFYAQGRLSIAPGLWVVPDLNLPDGESFLQQARLGKEWIAQHLGEEPRVCWIADCWGHHPQMPQIARTAGYEGYVFWRCMRPELQKADFLWKGLDGSSILTHWLARGYANLRFPTEAEAVNAAELRFNSGRNSIASLLEELDQYGQSGDGLLCNGGDMAFPQSTAPAEVNKLAHDLPSVQLTFSSLQRFFDSQIPENLPIAEGEFNSSLSGSFTSNIRLKLLNRTCTERLLALEKLAVLQGMPMEFDSLWKLLLKQQFHDTICGTLADAPLEDAYLEFTELEALLDARAMQLGGALGNPAPKGWFNACSFPRTVWLHSSDDAGSLIELPAHGSSPGAAALRFRGEQGGELPFEFVTPKFHAKFNREGYVISLIELESGEECVSSEQGPFGALVMTPDYGDLWLNHAGPLNGGGFQSSLTQNHPDPLRRGGTEDIVNQGPFWPEVHSVRILLQGHDVLIFEQRGRIHFWRSGIDFTTTVRLCRALPQIEYSTHFIPHGRDFRLRALFGTPFVGGEVRYEVPFGIAVRGIGEHAAQRFVDIRGPGAGLAVINRGTAGHAVEEGAILMSVFRSVAMEYKAQSLLSYNESIPHEIQYAVMPHAGSATAEIVMAAAAFNQLPIPLAENIHTGGFTTDCEQVMVTSLRLNHEGCCVRLVETTGHPANVRVFFPSDFTHWAPSDGLGRRIGSWTRVTDNACWQGKLNAWQIVTLLVSKSAS